MRTDDLRTPVFTREGTAWVYDVIKRKWKCPFADDTPHGQWKTTVNGVEFCEQWVEDRLGAACPTCGAKIVEYRDAPR